MTPSSTPRRFALGLLAALTLPATSAADLTFAPPAVITDSIGNPDQIQAVDLDGDGDLDIIATEEVYGPVVWWENLGKGNYRRAGEWRHENASVVRIADFDGDGRVDLLVATLENASDFHYTLWKGAGLAGFPESGPDLAFSPAAFGPVFLSFADVNADGREDVIVRDKVWLNQGGGAFTAAPGTPLPASAVQFPGSKLVWTDVNGDGLPDCVYSRGAALTASLNQGAAGFSDPVDLIPALLLTNVIDLAAVRLPDISPQDCMVILEYPQGDTNVSLLAKGANGWERVATRKVRSPQDAFGVTLSVATDGDRQRILLDCLANPAGTRGANLATGKILEITAKKTARTGVVTLTSKALTGLPKTAASLQFADLTGDGKNDALYATRGGSAITLPGLNQSWGSIQWQPGTGAGRFTRAVHAVSQPMLSRRLEFAGDLDGDGDADLLTSMPELSHLSLRTNNDHGASFTTSTLFTRGTYSRVVKVLETGAQAKILVYATTLPRREGGNARNELVLLTRTPRGIFAQRTLASETSLAWDSVELQDGDGDGIMDLRVFTAQAPGQNFERLSHWLPGVSAVKFRRATAADATRFPLADQTRLDVNWDGKTDLWQGGLDNDGDWIENTGTAPGVTHTGPGGQFYSAANLPIGKVFPAGVDFDGDGHPDYLTGNSPILANGAGDPSDPFYPLSLSAAVLQQTFTITGTSRFVGTAAFVDLDGDGDLDYLGANPASNLVWRENQGGLNYGADHVIDPGTQIYYDVNLLADIDGDGIPDVVSSAYSGERIVWFKGSRP